ncbi:MAG: MFS transporter, partial [Syntrophales bacterium LBB04]|nr:MFS transporter [Syntrophales bacterium LBB04]
RKILLLTQSSMMVLAGVLSLCSRVDVMPVTLIYGISALLAIVTAFDSPAWQAMVPNLVPKEHLMNALSLNNVMRHTAMIIGPSLAGFIIAWKGVSAVYIINMTSFVAILIAVIRMKTETQTKLGTSRATLSAMREGIQFVRCSKILLSTTLLDFFSTFFSSATALLPIFAKDILMVGPQGLGILHAGRSIGGVIAASGMSFIGNLKRKGRLMLYAVTIYASATILFGGSRWFLLSLLSLILVGAGDTVSAIMRQNIRQMETPDRLRGRMNSITQLFFMGGPQLGNLEAGIVAAFIGAPWSVITGGMANLMYVGVVAKKYPELKNYES